MSISLNVWLSAIETRTVPPTNALKTPLTYNVVMYMFNVVIFMFNVVISMSDSPQ